MQCPHEKSNDPASQVIEEYIGRQYEAYAGRVEKVIAARKEAYLGQPCETTAYKLHNAHHNLEAIKNTGTWCTSCRNAFLEPVKELVEYLEAGLPVRLATDPEGRLMLVGFHKGPVL